jgi:DMSO/TMAO reductase YedYZ heme-binding membrane subunit
LKKPEEIHNLLIIAALAFIILTLLAIQYDQPFWRKKVQRVRKDRKVLSFFTFAYKLIHYFFDNDIGFNISFQFSKNYNYFFSGST